MSQKRDMGYPEALDVAPAGRAFSSVVFGWL